MTAEKARWSDDKLEEFHNEFKSHMETEKIEQHQQQALYDAVFRKEDKEANVPPGLLQMMSRMNEQMLDMQIWQDRQKTFVGGVVFTVSALWFFLSDAGPKILAFLKRLS
jgi:hypothetical protein